MSQFTFTKAVKRKEKLRMALDGPPGSGKTWTSLTLAQVLAADVDGRIAVIDSERGSARKYASDFDFDHLELPDNSPHTYIGAIRAADEAGYAAIIIDSLSHAWEGTLELKDNVTKRQRGDSFGAWREVTPVHNELVDTMLRVRAHLIVTMRTKMAHEIETDERTGKNKVVKLGLKPIQRDGVEYELDVVGDLDDENTLTISKSRCSALAGAVIRRPDEHLAKTLLGWLDDGEDAPPPPPPTVDSTSAKRRVLDACGGDRDRARAAWPFGDAPRVDAGELADLLASLAGGDPFDDDPDPDGPDTTSAPAEGERTTKEASGASDSVADLDEGSPAPDEGALGPEAGEGDDASTAAVEDPAPAEGAIEDGTRRRLFALVGECCPPVANLSSAANDEVAKQWLLVLVQALDGTVDRLESRSLISEHSARKAVLACEEIAEGRASYEDFVEGRVRITVRANGGMTVQRKRTKAA